MSCIRLINRLNQSSVRNLAIRRIQTPQPVVRAFATQSVQVMEPEQVYQELAEGHGLLVDLRSHNGDIPLHKDAVAFPYEAILGSDRGLEEVAGTFSRDELLAMVSEAQLGAAEYHATAQQALSLVQAHTGDNKMDVAKAQKWVASFVDELQKPAAMAKTASLALERSLNDQVAQVKSQFSSGKVTPSVDATVTVWRENFKRYLSLKPKTVTRFDAQPKDKADHQFANEFLNEMRLVYGATATHEDVLGKLAKRKLGDVLKDNKTFVSGAYLDFLAAYNKAKVALYAKSIADLDPKEMESLSDVIGAHSEPWRAFLAYNSNPTKADLAKSHSDADLMRLAGLTNGNLGDHLDKAVAENAKSALSALPQTRPLFLVCSAAQHSQRVAAALAAAGAGDVRVVAGGADRWMLRDIPSAPLPSIEQKYSERINAAVGEKRSAIADINE